MSDLKWHARLALAILKIAEGERLKNTYVASCIALRSFEEIIDAYSAEEGLHFHDKFSDIAWKDRIEWMLINRKDLLYDWKLLVELYSSISVGGQHTSNEFSLTQLMTIVIHHLKILIDNYDC
jgi:hypothetical protein